VTVLAPLPPDLQQLLTATGLPTSP
jgi:hypothetical protein